MENSYYKELHTTARHYDNKMWAGLASFLIVVGWIGSNLDLSTQGPNIFSILLTNENAFRLFFVGLISFIILMKFVKEHGIAILIQNEINKADKDILNTVPLYSSENFPEILKKANIKLYTIPIFEHWLFKRRVSGWLMWFMFLVMIFSFGLAFRIWWPFIKNCINVLQ